MTSIIIAGRANSEDMAECILLAENIKDMYPTSRFTIVLKHQSEWEPYVEDVCNLFGIKLKPHPLIFFSNGKLIGNQQDFYKLIKESFAYEALKEIEKEKGKSEYILEVDKNKLNNLVSENKDIVEKEYHRRKEGLYVADIIEKKLEEFPVEVFETRFSKYNSIEVDFEKCYIKDMLMYSKYYHKFNPIESDYNEIQDVKLSGKVTVPCEEYNKWKKHLWIKKKKEIEESKTPEERQREEEERIRKEEEEKKRLEEEERRRQEEEEERKRKEEEEKAKSKKKGKDKKKGPEKEEKKEVKKEEVKQVVEEKKKDGPEEITTDKELEYEFFKDFDIPIEEFDDDIRVDKNNNLDYELLINPYFTFFGETIINPLKYAITGEEEPSVQEELFTEEKEEVKENVVLSEGGESVQKSEGNNNNPENANPEENNKSPEEAGKSPEEAAKAAEENKVEEAKKLAEEAKKEEVKKEEAKKPGEEAKNESNNPSEIVPAEEEKKEEELKSSHNPLLPQTSDPDSINASSPEKICIKDFGKLPSLRRLPYEDDEDFKFYKHNIPLYQIHSKQNNKTNLFDFRNNILSDEVIESLIQSITDTNGFATLRILPYKYTDYKNFGSNKIKILPRNPRELKRKEYPLEMKAEQLLLDIKRELYEKNLGDNKKKKKRSPLGGGDELMIFNEDYYNNVYTTTDNYTLDFFQSEGINHRIHFYNSVLNKDNIKNDLAEMFKELNITNINESGYILICCQRFLFVAPLTSPFAHSKSGIPIFAEPHFFMGVFTLPIIESEWPISISQKHEKFDLLEILKKSTALK